MIESNEKIKLLVIGDSLSAGYNSAYGFDISGNGKRKKEDFILTGLSYGSFFCDYVEKTQKGKMEWYENFAMQGSRISDWLYFYNADITKYNYKNSKDVLEIIQDIDKKKSRLNLFRNRTFKQFGNFQSEKNFNLLKERTFEANLIFVSLGANDLFNEINLESFSFLKDKNIKIKEKMKKYKKVLAEFEEKTFTKTFLLLQSIRKINPNAEIVFLSYPLTFLKVRTFISSIIGKNKLENVWENEFNKMTTNVQKRVSIANENVYYINPFDSEYWVQNAKFLSKFFYEIHPSTIGYKKIAKNIFYKLSFEKKTFEKTRKIIPSIQMTSYLEDLNSYEKIINFPFTELEIIKKLSWDSQDEIDLFIENKMEKKYSIMENKGDFGNFYYTLYNFIKTNYKFLAKIFNEATTIDTSSLEKEFFNIFLEKNNHFSLTNFIYRNEFLNNIIQELNDEFDDLIFQDHFRIQKFENVALMIQKIISLLTNKEKIFDFLRALNNFGFFKGNLEKFTTLINKYSKIIINRKSASEIISLIFKNIYTFLSYDYKQIFNKYLESNDEKIIEKIVNKIENKEKIRLFFYDLFMDLVKQIIEIETKINLDQMSGTFSKIIFEKHKETILDLIQFLFTNEILGKLFLHFGFIFIGFKVDVEKLFYLLKPNFQKMFSTSIFEKIVQNILSHIFLHPFLPFSKKNVFILLKNVIKVDLTNSKQFLEIINSINFQEIPSKDIVNIVNYAFDNSDNNFFLFQILKYPKNLEYLPIGMKFNLLNITKVPGLRKSFYSSIKPIFEKIFEEYKILRKKGKKNKENEAFKALYRLSTMIKTLFYLSIKNSNLHFSNLAFLNENTQITKYFTKWFPKEEMILKEIFSNKYKINNLKKNEFSKNETLPLIYFLFEKNPNEKMFYNYEILIRYLKNGFWD